MSRILGKTRRGVGTRKILLFHIACMGHSCVLLQTVWSNDHQILLVLFGVSLCGRFHTVFNVQLRLHAVLSIAVCTYIKWAVTTLILSVYTQLLFCCIRYVTEKISFSDRSVDSNRSTRSHIQTDWNLRQPRCGYPTFRLKPMLAGRPLQWPLAV